VSAQAAVSVSERIAARRARRSSVEERTVPLRSMDGATQGSVLLDGSLFGIEPNMAVLHQVVTAQMAGARAGTHSTKRRREVRGGGRKPWRQKGTGRARQGSIRATQWVGGGIPMGPKPRSYAQSTPKKMVRLALASALSDRAAEGRIVVVSSWDFERPKTREAVEALSALGVAGKVLLVLGDAFGTSSGADETAFRSFANLPDVAIVPAGLLTAWDVLRSDWVVFTSASLAALSGTSEAPEPTASTQTPVASESAEAGGGQGRAQEGEED
jgi:large subunit ribosomal protein L4